MKNFLILFFLNLLSVGVFAQTESSEAKPWDNLKKLDLSSHDPTKGLKIDMMETAFYDKEGLKLTMAQVIKYSSIASGTDEPTLYIDENEEVKVIVFNNTTQELEAALANKMSEETEDVTLKKGEKIKDFSVKDIKGNTYNTADLKGKIIVIKFWFIKCQPCIMEMPELNELVEKYKEKEVVFLGLALDDEKALQSFIEKTAFHYNIVAKSTKLANQFDVEGYPTHFIVDKEGTIVYEAKGFTSFGVRNLDKAIKIALK